MQNRIEFVKKLSALAETLGTQMSEAKLWIYEQALRRFSDEQVSAAIGAAASTLTFFPKPVELIELIEGKREEQSTLAWETLLYGMQHVGGYQSVRFEDGRIARAVRLMGGWQKVCRTETKYLNHLRNDFTKIYKSLPPDTDPETLEGIAELSAFAEGYPDRSPPPVLLDGGGCAAGHTGQAQSGGQMKKLNPKEKRGHQVTWDGSAERTEESLEGSGEEKTEGEIINLKHFETMRIFGMDIGASLADMAGGVKSNTTAGRRAEQLRMDQRGRDGG